MVYNSLFKSSFFHKTNLYVECIIAPAAKVYENGNLELQKEKKFFYDYKKKKNKFYVFISGDT